MQLLFGRFLNSNLIKFPFSRLAQKLKGLVEQYEVREQVCNMYVTFDKKFISVNLTYAYLIKSDRKALMI